MILCMRFLSVTKYSVDSIIRSRREGGMYYDTLCEPGCADKVNI